MKVPFVDLKLQYQSIKAEIDAAIAEVLQNTSFIGGDKVTLFEEAFAQFVKTDFCVSCANGTDALEIALEAMGVGAGDEVIVPAYTWVSSASAVVRVGAKPILVDVHPDYYTLDPERIKSAITSGTKAIMPVHFYGLPADMPAIMQLAETYGLLVIEDCAQAHGATIQGQPVGTFGDMATYSFYPGKNLGAYGDGGAMVTNNPEFAEKARIIARLGQRKKHDHVQPGRNSRLDSLQAAILRIKLPHLHSWTEARIKVAGWYAELLSDLPIVLPGTPQYYRHVWHLYVIQTKDRDALKDFLKSKDIHTQIHYPKPLNQLGLFFSDDEFPVSDAMAPGLLSLPMYGELTRAQVEYVSDCIRAFF